jgi:hypothetical protein
LAAAVCDAFKCDAALKLLAAKVATKRVVAHASAQVGSALSELPSGIRPKSVLIKLDPKPVQRVGTVVVIVDRLASLKAVRGGVEADFDVIVNLLLPVVRSGSATGSAKSIRRWKIAVVEPFKGIGPGQ